MKKLAAGTSLLLLSCVLIMSKPTRTYVQGNDGRTWVLIISPHTTKHQLDSVERAWEKDSIFLQFSKLKYTSSGKLVKVCGTVTSNVRGDSASAKFSSENLKSLEIKVNDRPDIAIMGH